MTRGIAVDIQPFLHQARHRARCIGGPGISFHNCSEALLAGLRIPGVHLLHCYRDDHIALLIDPLPQDG